MPVAAFCSVATGLLDDVCALLLGAALFCVALFVALLGVVLFVVVGCVCAVGLVVEIWEEFGVLF